MYKRGVVVTDGWTRGGISLPILLFLLFLCKAICGKVCGWGAQNPYLLKPSFFLRKIEFFAIFSTGVKFI